MRLLLLWAEKTYTEPTVPLLLPLIASKFHPDFILIASSLHPMSIRGFYAKV